jgi:tellurite methyltransferase
MNLKEQFGDIDIYLFDQLFVQKLAMNIAPDWSNKRIRVDAVEKMSFDDHCFDIIISSAVLHFAENEAHFQQMVHELWRVLKLGGRMFVRLASSIGIETKVKPLGNERYKLPDGSIRFLVDEERLQKTTEELKGILFEPIKTVNVADQRCMSTWCVRKSM